jgi:hypothetical protein
MPKSKIVIVFGGEVSDNLAGMEKEMLKLKELIPNTVCVGSGISSSSGLWENEDVGKLAVATGIGKSNIIEAIEQIEAQVQLEKIAEGLSSLEFLDRMAILEPPLILPTVREKEKNPNEQRWNSTKWYESYSGRSVNSKFKVTKHHRRLAKKYR